MTPTLGTVAPVGFDDFASPDWLECMKTLGCTTAQIYRNRHGNLSGRDEPVTARQMQDYLAAAQLPCDSLHGLYGNDIDPSSPNEAVRKHAVDVFKREGELALTLGGPMVIVHGAGIFTQGIDPAETDHRWSQLHRSAEELAAFGLANRVHFALENLPPYHAICSDVGRLAALVRQIDSEWIGLCFDIAHANIAGDPIPAIDQAGELTSYVHVCDNQGQKDEHLMSYTGGIDFQAGAEGFARIGYRGVLMLETFYSVEQLRKLIDQGFAEKLADFLRRASGQSHA